MPVKKPVAKKTVASRAKTTATAPAKKKTTRAVSATKKPAASTAPAKRGPGRPRIIDPETVQIAPAQSYVHYTEKDYNRTVQGIKYKDLAQLMGVGVGSERFLVAVELLKGGKDRLDVSARIATMMPLKTRNGTDKSVSNLVTQTLGQLGTLGFTTVGSWKVAKPANLLSR